MEDERETAHLKQRRKKPSPISLSCCCFQGHNDLELPPPSSPQDKPSTPRSPSAWLRSKSHDLPHLKHKCRSLITRMSGNSRRHSADFRYDPLSYSLNFDQGLPSDDSHAEGFSARLPVSPPAIRDLDFNDATPRAASAAMSSIERRQASREILV